MILEKTLIKKIDDYTLIENVPPKEGGGVREWRKGLNALDIKLSQVLIESKFTVNKIDHFAHTIKNIDKKSELKESIFKYIKRDASRSRKVRGKCFKFDNNLYGLVKESEDSALHKHIKLSEGIYVDINECEDEPQRGEPHPNSAYYGTLYYGTETLKTVIECMVPTSQMDKLINDLNQIPSPEVSIIVEVASFSCEIYGDNLLLEEYSEAFLVSINVSSLIQNPVEKIEYKTYNNKKDPMKTINRWLLIISILLILQILS
ncbi:MAG: hypothetical protein H6862_03230 [Rhodospirillales bacterium]|nr:hypothetical protein [Rhodospirillales bacterium]